MISFPLPYLLYCPGVIMLRALKWPAVALHVLVCVYVCTYVQSCALA